MGRMLRVIVVILSVVLVHTASCTWPGNGKKNVEKMCIDLAAIAQKIGDDVNRFDDICRQMTTIVRMSDNYNDNIHIVFVLEKVNLLRIIAAYEQKFLELLCRMKEEYRGDFCQERLESLQRTIGLTTLHVETLQNIAHKITNSAARYQIEEIIRTLRSTSTLYQQSIAILQSLRLSK